MLDVVLKFLLGFEIFVAVVLGFLIMIQRSKSGGGLGGLSGGGAAEEVLGAGSASMVVKATVVFALVFLVNTLTITALEANVKKTEDAVSGLLGAKTTGPGTAGAVTTDTETAPAPAAAPAAGDDEEDVEEAIDTVGDDAPADEAAPAEDAAPAPVDEPAIEDPEPVAAP